MTNLPTTTLLMSMPGGSEWILIVLVVLLIFGGKKIPELMKGIILINVLVFGACFAVMAIFTFLPPIILTGLIFVSLVLSYLFVHSSPVAAE